MDHSENISQDALEQYAMETLPEPEIAPLETHLLVCEVCQDRPPRHAKAASRINPPTSMTPVAGSGIVGSSST